MRIFFCNGQPKSGSTFCFQLVRQLVPHRALRVDDPELSEAIKGNEAAQRILHRTAGDYTGYVSGSIDEAAHVLASLSLPADTVLVVKTHDATPIAAPLLPAPAVVVTTFRDPIDVMVALKDQNDREKLRPASDIRPGFLKYDEYAKALVSASLFTARLLTSFSSSNWYIEYPAFIRPSPVGLARMAALLGADEVRIAAAVERLDLEVREGKTLGEFNRGEVGRGRRIIEELVRSGQVSGTLAQDGMIGHRELVRRVEHHKNGLTAA
jgi:hypothetical protein